MRILKNDGVRQWEIRLGPVTVASRTMGILNDGGGIASECGYDDTDDDDADRDTRYWGQCDSGELCGLEGWGY